MTDHYAEANRLISATDTRDWNDPSPYVDRRIAAAQVHAVLALAEQQRIANVIALTRADSIKAVEQADNALYTRTSVPAGIELPLRPDIARTLRIETP